MAEEDDDDEDSTRSGCLSLVVGEGVGNLTKFSFGLFSWFEGRNDGKILDLEEMVEAMEIVFGGFV